MSTFNISTGLVSENSKSNWQHNNKSININAYPTLEKIKFLSTDKYLFGKFISSSNINLISQNNDNIFKYLNYLNFNYSNKCIFLNSVNN